MFAELGFEEALARSRGEGRWLLVDATAKWCGPCKLMDRTTWKDAEVAAWVETHGLAIKLDVDDQSETAQALGIQAMPTVIVFRGGEEQDRVVGMKKPADLLAWLAGVERGETALDRVERELADPEHDMQGRLELAQALLQGRRFDRALEHYAWLWQHIHRVEPGMGGVRVSFMAGEIEGLTSAYPPARARFAALRDEAEAAAAGAGDAGMEARFDWVVLNGALDETDRTVAWFDAVKGDPASAPLLAALEHWLIPILRERDRLADIGRLLADPVNKLRGQHEQAQRAVEAMASSGRGDGMSAQMEEALRHHLRDQAGLYHKALGAAGRVAEAAALKDEALKLDGSEEMQATLA
jgi:thioredoxin 1